MPRRRTPPRRPRPLPAALDPRRIETGPDGYDYEVRAVAGSRATKVYRCPGCDHEIRVGLAHVVVWPAGGDGWAAQSAVDDRRHWHTPCWSHRATRGPTRKWS